MLKIEACENGFIVKELNDNEFKALRIWVATDPESLGAVIKAAVAPKTEAQEPLRMFHPIGGRRVDEHNDGPHAA